ncbi:hypothetical protein CDL12_02279 [Handroanthus impetiginosus]|uniref:Uncharacterized protein n=1 Tax=Handroanthus impetiginosus TaxID=429701 RepID=A0A2G9I5E4_9LAMI|nr:hypothetical protein CDL12_02279 [Handroanthus impetiginosus]
MVVRMCLFLRVSTFNGLNCPKFGWTCQLKNINNIFSDKYHIFTFYIWSSFWVLCVYVFSTVNCVRNYMIALRKMCLSVLVA